MVIVAGAVAAQTSGGVPDDGPVPEPWRGCPSGVRPQRQRHHGVGDRSPVAHQPLHGDHRGGGDGLDRGSPGSVAVPGLSRGGPGDTGGMVQRGGRRMPPGVGAIADQTLADGPGQTLTQHQWSDGIGIGSEGDGDAGHPIGAHPVVRPHRPLDVSQRPVEDGAPLDRSAACQVGWATPVDRWTQVHVRDGPGLLAARHQRDRLAAPSCACPTCVGRHGSPVHRPFVSTAQGLAPRRSPAPLNLRPQAPVGKGHLIIFDDPRPGPGRGPPAAERARRAGGGRRRP